MGRETSEPAPPPASVRRAERSRFAKETIHKTIPALLNSNPRARRGVEGVQLLTDLPRVPVSSGKAADKPAMKIRILDVDSFAAAAVLAKSSVSGSGKAAPPKVAVLSMASPLRPGGGVFTGATSQEESLCVRSTLYPSLREEFYRLPPLGSIYTPDVLVFRDEGNKDLSKRDRFYVDVISCAALRFPELEGGRYEKAADREQMWGKMRAVMRAAVQGGVSKVVLGAWGCGAYGNPVEEIADAWRRVLIASAGKGGRGNKEEWDGVEEVVFAISTKHAEGEHQLEVFRKVFEGVAIEEEIGEIPTEAEVNREDETLAEDIHDLEEAIKLKESQLDQIRNEDLRKRVAEVLVKLKRELATKLGQGGITDGIGQVVVGDDTGSEDVAGGSSSKSPKD